MRNELPTTLKTKFSLSKSVCESTNWRTPAKKYIKVVISLKIIFLSLWDSTADEAVMGRLTRE
jgi:hypothetical protein